jgi:hypothetical protein
LRHQIEFLTPGVDLHNYVTDSAKGKKRQKPPQPIAVTKLTPGMKLFRLTALPWIKFQTRTNQTIQYRCREMWAEVAGQRFVTFSTEWAPIPPNAGPNTLIWREHVDIPAQYPVPFSTHTVLEYASEDLNERYWLAVETQGQYPVLGHEKPTWTKTERHGVGEWKPSA